MEALLFIGIGLFVYFIPSIVGKDKSNAGAIFLLNLFLGWTLVGWVVALVWAATNDPPKPNRNISAHTNEAGSSKVDQIEKLKKLFDQGALTESEYQRAKDKILM